MTTKRENYTIREKFKIIKKSQEWQIKASLFCKRGIPEGTICGWVKTEDD
jgi:hypothetical protein